MTPFGRFASSSSARAVLIGLIFLLGFTPVLANVAAQPTQAANAAVTWRLLDYIAVDYAGAVQDGKIVSSAEYAEMSEFSATVVEQLKALPEHPRQASLIHEAQGLVLLIEQQAVAADVAALARSLGAAVIHAYPVPLAPARVPEAAQGAKLYQTLCVSCHGATGAGDGPAAGILDPAPVDFTDASRARERSLFALYQVITQGLEGTAMPSYAQLPDDDRWALAFHVGQFAYPETATDVSSTEADDAGVRSLRDLVQMTPAALAAEVGDARAAALTAHWRRYPPVVSRLAPDDQWALVHTRLEEALAAYARGDRSVAETAALSAYLDGIEPVEPTIAARLPDLLPRIERSMMALRAGINRGVPADDVRVLVDDVNAVVNEIAVGLATPSDDDGWSGFLGALTILVREGLEALLIVIAMIAFLRKAERPDVLKYVHAGWVGALAAGGATWAVATYAIGISGAQRELVEGFSALLAAVVLVSVGLWLHQKSYAGRWQQYLKGKLSEALTRPSAWVLFGLSFIAVYREVFETILFFTAMWNEQGGNQPVIAGFGAGVLILVVITIAMLRFSKRLPIGQFFSWSSMLMAILAVVLAGKGIAALQEAGWLAVAPVAVPRMSWLGFYPTWQTVLAQAFTVVVLVFGYWWNTRAAGEPTRRDPT